MNSQDPSWKLLQDRLRKLEADLRQMLESTNDDLHVARVLQAQLMPNRLPEITGLQAQSRYISARDLSAESYDLIPVHRNRELWILHTWTSNFGLSSVLLQTLVHMKSAELVRDAQSPEVEVVFDKITEALCEAQKKGSYRLMVAKLDLNKLLLTGVSVGQSPILLRKFEKGVLGDFSLIDPENLLKNPKLMDRATNQEPISAFRAHRFSHQLTAGSRFFVVGREWNADAPLEHFCKPLDLSQLQDPASEDSLLSNLNGLAMRMEDHIKTQVRKSDVTVLGFEINAKILHLA
jgi:hypothetical protein